MSDILSKRLLYKLKGATLLYASISLGLCHTSVRSGPKSLSLLLKGAKSGINVQVQIEKYMRNV